VTVPFGPLLALGRRRSSIDAPGATCTFHRSAATLARSAPEDLTRVPARLVVRTALMAVCVRAKGIVCLFRGCSTCGRGDRRTIHLGRAGRNAPTPESCPGVHNRRQVGRAPPVCRGRCVDRACRFGRSLETDYQYLHRRSRADLLHPRSRRKAGKTNGFALLRCFARKRRASMASRNAGSRYLDSDSNGFPTPDGVRPSDNRHLERDLSV